MPSPAAFMSFPRTLALAVLVACAIGLAAASPGQAATFGTQGVSSGPGSLNQNMAVARRAGARMVRVNADWARLEPQAGGQRDDAELKALDDQINAAVSNRMQVVLLIVGTPCWASAAPDADRADCAGPNANRDSVTRYQPRDPTSVVPIATFLAKRYADRLAAFQVWNEPDQRNEKYWAGPNKISKYVAVAQALYGPLKEAAPGVPVLVGSFVGTDGRWLQALYDAGLKGSYDGLAVQFYSQTLSALRATRAVQRANGDSKPLWLTEFGLSDCYRKGGPATQLDQPCYSRGSAARGISDILAALRKRTWVKAAIQFSLYDDPPGGYTFGLATREGKRKSTYNAVRRVLTGRVRKPRAPKLRVRRSRGRVVVSGTASVAEFLKLRVDVAGVPRFRLTRTVDRLGRFRLTLPPVLGTRNITVRAYSGWTGRKTARLR